MSEVHIKPVQKAEAASEREVDKSPLSVKLSTSYLTLLFLFLTESRVINVHKLITS